MKQNCWEFKKCGRQPQGQNARHLGVCPAAAEESLDEVHGGTNAGRACWVVAGTLCGGKVQGTFGAKYKSCEQCDFYQAVRAEEKGNFQYSTLLLVRMRNGCARLQATDRRTAAPAMR
ncbi:MAG: hypothetical protein M0042_12275 [Nitrospiraceae bacterium]|nr:hypothetical protein [Nitrospiraceae bacterium]